MDLNRSLIQFRRYRHLVPDMHSLYVYNTWTDTFYLSGPDQAYVKVAFEAEGNRE